MYNFNIFNTLLCKIVDEIVVKINYRINYLLNNWLLTFAYFYMLVYMTRNVLPVLKDHNCHVNGVIQLYMFVIQS